jgi:hypothetical protein
MKQLLVILLLIGHANLHAQLSGIIAYDKPDQIAVQMEELENSYLLQGFGVGRIHYLYLLDKFNFEIKSEVIVDRYRQLYFFPFKESMHVMASDNVNGRFVIYKVKELEEELIVDSISENYYPDYIEYMSQSSADDVWDINFFNSRGTQKGLITWNPVDPVFPLVNLSFELDSNFIMNFDTTNIGYSDNYSILDLEYRDSSIYLASDQAVRKYNLEYELQNDFITRGLSVSQGGHLHLWHDIIIYNTYFSPFSSFNSTIETYVLDSNFQLIEHWSTGEDTMINFPAWSEPFCELDSQNLLLAGNLGEFYWFLEPDGEFGSYVCSYDENLDTNWIVEIYEEGSSIVLSGLHKADNGNAIAFGRKRVREENWVAYPILVEISPEGTIVNSTTPVIHNQEAFNIYPNPVQSELHISLIENINMEQIDEILIFDQQGRIVDNIPSKGFSSQRIGVDHLPSGQYYVTLITSKGQFGTRKLIKL